MMAAVATEMTKYDAVVSMGHWSDIFDHTKGYPTNFLNDTSKKVLLNDSTTAVRVAFVGPEGAGKTSLINLLFGLKLPTDTQPAADGASGQTLFMLHHLTFGSREPSASSLSCVIMNTPDRQQRNVDQEADAHDHTHRDDLAAAIAFEFAQVYVVVAGNTWSQHDEIALERARDCAGEGRTKRIVVLHHLQHVTHAELSKADVTQYVDATARRYELSTRKVFSSKSCATELVSTRDVGVDMRHYFLCNDPATHQTTLVTYLKELFADVRSSTTFTTFHEVSIALSRALLKYCPPHVSAFEIGFKHDRFIAGSKPVEKPTKRRGNHGQSQPCVVHTRNLENMLCQCRADNAHRLELQQLSIETAKEFLKYAKSCASAAPKIADNLIPLSAVDTVGSPETHRGDSKEEGRVLPPEKPHHP